MNPTPNSPRLAPRQRAILALVDEYWRTRGYAPAFRKICLRLHIPSTSIARHHALRLEQMGLLHIPREDEQMLAHTMRLTDAGRAALATPTNGQVSTDTKERR